MKTKISVLDLKCACDAGTPVCIIDTLPPEYCENEHIPGAQNACVFEMVFLDKVASIVNDPNTRIVVYGASDRSKDAAIAVEKLSRAGYQNVCELAGGLEAWQKAGYSVEPQGTEKLEIPVLVDGSYILDVAASRVEWTGRNINGRHYGTLNVAGGEMVIDSGVPSWGLITLDMNSIVNFDLKDEVYNKMLISHLVSDDFFDVVNHPTAAFRVSSSKKVEDAPAGAPNVLINGTLQLIGKTKPLSFSMEIVPQAGGSIKLQSSFDIDRTQWGIIYGSGRFFEKLGMHLVSDIISIELFLTAKPE